MIPAVNLPLYPGLYERVTLINYIITGIRRMCYTRYIRVEVSNKREKRL